MSNGQLLILSNFSEYALAANVPCWHLDQIYLFYLTLNCCFEDSLINICFHLAKRSFRSQSQTSFRNVEKGNFIFVNWSF